VSVETTSTSAAVLAWPRSVVSPDFPSMK
jgi:hypothetical protein